MIEHLSDRPAHDIRVGNAAAQPGKTLATRLRVDGLSELDQPHVNLIGGLRPGPVVLIVAGLHGAEVSSIEAARRLSMSLAPRLVRGTVIVVPVVNAAAFFARSLYVNPRDGKNVNRAFPGSATGTATDRLAHAVVEQLVRPADIVMDLHGGDLVEGLDPFMVVDAAPGSAPSGRSLCVAQAFGLPQVITTHVAGSLVAAATQMGKAALLAEAGHNGLVCEEAVTQLVQGVTRVLAAADMLDASAVQEAPCPAYRPGWTWLSSDSTGFWRPCVDVGEEVLPGSPLGTIEPMSAVHAADEVVQLASPHAGRVVFLVTALSTVPDTPLLAVAQPADEWPPLP